MRTADMVKSKYWRGADVQGRPVILTIADVTEEQVGGRGSKPDIKCFLWFMENLKGLQLNKTRVAVLEAAYGPDSVLWTGRKVRLSFDPTVMMAGQLVGGVRLETEKGAVYVPGHQTGAWGEAPGPAAGAAPPVPVLDPATGQWVLPSAAPAPLAARPPVPVLNPQTGQWELPKTAHVPPLTMKQRMDAGHPPAMPQVPSSWPGMAPAEGSVDAATGEIGPSPDFDDDIPF